MSASDKVFLDTNVLVYAHDRAEPTKGKQASQLLNQLVVAGRPLASIQVLSEFYWAVTRKIALPLSHDEAAQEITRLETLMTVHPVSWQVLAKALGLMGTHKMALWDTQIIAAAVLLGATVILSEDFQHRQMVEGILILNPFAADFQASEVLPS